ncbi:type II toxin-antitoxin system PemK/MazF family toxin [Alkalibacillus haloalkaliphilus]|uniref:Uncharacterized protein n=1 Tax=Alkalibacillus haloalkaliphilus TaxID=94136 RepID=A0A511W3U2_9BACI|nr:type II toxin-antitoxin system PemK/MazF family toxin [Alkalibacillus haloalkaliphilus]GEN45431.1 hypothetical protein AHA02nite_12070 [Alkalibacillus haloalkaliphilus]
MEIGEIYYMDVEFEEQPNKSKNRPVIIFGEHEEEILLLISTTTKGRKHPISYYDQFKIPIPNWRKSGLSEPSWCRGYRLIEISKAQFKKIVKKHDYIGKLHPEDFNYILEEFVKIHKANQPI